MDFTPVSKMIPRLKPIPLLPRIVEMQGELTFAGGLLMAAHTLLDVATGVPAEDVKHMTAQSAKALANVERAARELRELIERT